MLRLLDITKEYKVDEESVLALHGVSIGFRKSEFVSILGPSGCGKTTLLNIVGGLDRYTSGDIRINGISTKEYDDVDWDTYRNRKIGFVFQSYNLIPHMNILNNVAMGLTLAGIDKEERKARAKEALRKVGLDTQARKKPNQLSGGQMQRVAIARALVNNPDIILADEPTGALDSESGLQVMDLLKEVAEDRLVIMVTHNPSIAEEYSTRIVYLKDGEVVGDTMPITEEEDVAIAAEEEAARQKEDIAAYGEPVAECVSSDEISKDTGLDEVLSEKKTSSVKKPQRQESRFQKYRRKARALDKSAMKLSTAISLSFNNLLSKKGRTLLTSIAGSIGIIGIILVLALSAGVDNYITRMEEDALSQYPIEIGRSGFDLNSVMNSLSGSNSTKREEYPGGDTVYIQGILGNLFKGDNFNSILGGQNDLASLRDYLDANLDPSLGQVKYEYGTDFHIYTNNIEGKDEYFKVHPFSEFVDSMLEEVGDIAGGAIDKESLQQLMQYARSLDAWDEMSTNQTLLEQQYDVLKGHWPTEPEEIVVVLDSQNQINDYTLFMLGLISADDLLAAFSPDFANTKTFTLDDILGLEYKALTSAAYYTDNNDGTFTKQNIDESSFGTTERNEFVEEKASYTLKVSAVIRPKPGAVVTSINSPIAYSHELMKSMILKAEASDVVKAMEDVEFNAGKFVSPVSMIVNGKEIIAGSSVDDSYFDDMMTKLGYADINNPQKIKIYSSSFEAKDDIVALLDRYRATGETLTYTDMLELIMGYVRTLTTTVTGVLIGFSAISLIVSTIMIAIIIYTSVLERRKEIGVLRSLGARKKDISRVFLAESSIIGAFAGGIGLIFSGIFSAIGNAILYSVFQIENLMLVTWWSCLVMFLVSILLSMFAGFIPSRIAANKDPAIALRSE